MDNRRKTVMGDPINPDFGEGRWQDALRRMRERIAGGLKFVAWDDTTPGNKSTHCSWGMCSQDLEQWPESDDWLFPIHFGNPNFVATRRAPGGCPFDRRTGTDEEMRSGCFWSCRVFQEGKPIPAPEIISEYRKMALGLYDEVIAAREEKHGRKVTDDDDEPWRERG